LLATNREDGPATRDGGGNLQHTHLLPPLILLCILAARRPSAMQGAFSIYLFCILKLLTGPRGQPPAGLRPNLTLGASTNGQADVTATLEQQTLLVRRAH